MSLFKTSLRYCLAAIVAMLSFANASAVATDGTQDIYLSDNVVNVSPASSSTNGSGWKFSYDPVTELYSLYVPAGTASNYTTSGDFQISTKTGSYANWKTGAIWVAGYSVTSGNVAEANKMATNTKYSLTTTLPDGSAHWMNIKDYHYRTGYTFYINKDITKIWIVPDIYLHDNIVKESTGSSSFSTTFNWKFTYDPTAEKYQITVPGKYVGNSAGTTSGDIQFSTVRGSTYAEWVKGLLYATGHSVSTGSNVPDANRLYPGNTYTLNHVSSSNTTSYWSAVYNYDPAAIYTFEIAGDLSTLTVGQQTDRGLYITGSITGSSLPLVPAGATTCTDNRAYMVGKCGYFLYDNANGLYYYTFTTPLTSGDLTFSYSKYATLEGNYNLWDKGSSYVASGDCEDSTLRNIVEGLVYPATTGNEATRTISGLDTDTTYTLYITSDLTRLWIEPGSFKSSRLFIKSSNSFNGLTSNKYGVMYCNDDLYHYNVTSKPTVYFGLFTDPKATNRISAKNVSSSVKFSADGTKYRLFANTGGDELINTSSNDITIWVSRNGENVFDYVWVTDNTLAHQPLYALRTTATDYSAPTPLQFDSAANAYKLTNVPDGTTGEISYYISRFKSFSGDISATTNPLTAEQKAEGFNSGRFSFSPSTIGLNESAEMSTSGDNTTLTLGTHYGATLTVNEDQTQVTLTGSAIPDLYIKGSLDGASTARPMTFEGNNIYSYHATSALNGSFAIFSDQTCSTDNQLTCTNYSASQPLTNGGYYYLLKYGTGNQILDSSLQSASGVTIYIDIANKFLWIVKDDDAPKFFVNKPSSSTVPTKQGCYSPDEMTYLGKIDGVHQYSFTLPANEEDIEIAFGRAKSAENDIPASITGDEYESSPFYDSWFALYGDAELYDSEEDCLSLNYTGASVTTDSSAGSGSYYVKIPTHTGVQELRFTYSEADGTNPEVMTVTLMEQNSMEVEKDGNTIKIPALYIQGPTIDHKWTSLSYSTSGIDAPRRFDYDPVFDVYYCNLYWNQNYTSNSGQGFTISTTTGNSTLWYANSLVVPEIYGSIPVGQRFALETGNSDDQQTNALTADAFSSANDRCTVFVNREMNAIWVLPGFYASYDSNRTPFVANKGAADEIIPPLYLRGSMANAFGYTADTTLPFSFNADENIYFLTIPAGTSEVNGSMANFDISTQPAPEGYTDYIDYWGKSSIKIPSVDSTHPMQANEAEHRDAKLSTDGTINFINHFNKWVPYSVCVSADMSKVWIESETPLFITGPVTGKDYEGEIDPYDSDHSDHFSWDPINKVYYYEFVYDGSTYNCNTFEISTQLNDEAEGTSWNNGAMHIVHPATGYLALGERYTVLSGAAVNTIDSDFGENLWDGYTYTIYVNHSLSRAKIYEGPFNSNLAHTQDIYVSDFVVGNNYKWKYNQVKNWKMTYDPDNHWYYLNIPAGTGIGGDFQLSTTPGADSSSSEDAAYNEWKNGLIYIKRTSGTPTVIPDGRHYEAQDALPGNTTGYWQTISPYDHNYDYTIYLSGDRDEIWVTTKPKQLYIMGWFTQHPTGAYGNAAYRPCGDPMSGKRAMIYDEATNEYRYTMAGLRGSVFEISTAGSATSYNDWVAGMIAYMPSKNGVAVLQPELVANPEGTPFADLTTYPVDSQSGTGTARDNAIQGLDHDNLYTVHVSYDPATNEFKRIWVTTQQVYMPLKFEDFFKVVETGAQGEYQRVPHYFIVGTRTGDWRLLPEWELKPVEGEPNKVRLKHRFMYDGYFAIARVDNYLDYINHRYEIYANPLGDTDDQNLKSSSQCPIDLQYRGESGALHYTDDDYRHDSSNSILWNCDPGFTDETAPTDEMMNSSLPFYLEEFTVTLNNNIVRDGVGDEGSNIYPSDLASAVLRGKNKATMGAPVSFSFTGTCEAADILPYRTFSFVGSDVNWEAPFEFSKLGWQSLCTMHPAYLEGDMQRTFWANSWISWSAEDKPYYDAYNNTLPLTAYDKEWIDTHEVYFDMDIDGKSIEYNTENMVFMPVDLDNLDPDDEYAWLYSKHSASADKIGNRVISNANPTYQFTEKLIENYTEAFNALDNHTSMDAAYGTHTHTWKPYVIKDVWIRGDFKVWTGWGGHLKRTEGWENSEDEAEDIRWYYGNFGHNVPGRNFPIEGHDVLSNPTSDDDTNPKELYLTYRDVDHAYFTTNPRGMGVAPAKYFNRIILWYDTSSNRLDGGQPNGVLQFIRGTVLPNVQAFRTRDNDNKIIHGRLSVNFDLVDNTITTEIVDGDEVTIGDYDNWNVVNYQVLRYRMNGENEELYFAFDPIEVPAEKSSAKDWTRNTVGLTFDDPDVLRAGTYFYKVVIAVSEPDDADAIHYLSAVSNKINISAGDRPVRINASQLRYNLNNSNVEVESETGKLYSFDVKAVLRYPDDIGTLKANSHYSGGDFTVADDINSIVITVDEATAIVLNNCESEIVNAERLSKGESDLIYYAARKQWMSPRDYIEAHYDDPVNRPRYGSLSQRDDLTDQYNSAGDRLGWFIDDANKEGNEVKFTNVAGTNDWQIKFNYHKHYVRKNDYNATTGKYYTRPYRLFFQDVADMVGTLELPVIVWKDVRPTQNVAEINGVAVSQDAPNYTFHVAAIPDDVLVTDGNVETPLADVWRDVLNLLEHDSSTGVYAPSPTVTLSPEIAKYDGTISYDNVEYDNEEHIASMPIGATVNTNGSYSTAIPAHYTAVNEVKGDLTATLPLSSSARESVEVGYNFNLATAEFDTPLNYTVAGDTRSNNEFEATIHHLPVYDTESSGTSKIESSHHPGANHVEMSNARIVYRPTSQATYAGNNWSVVTRGIVNRNTGVLDLSAIQAPTFKLSQRNNGNDDMVFLYYQDEQTNEHVYRVAMGVTADGFDPEALNAYFGFDTNSVHSDYAHEGRRAQGGEPMYEISYTDSNDDAVNDFWTRWLINTTWGFIYDQTNTNNYSSKVDMMEGYKPYDSEAGYDDEVNNWARIAAKNNYLAIVVEPVYRGASKFTGEGDFNFVGYVTYPIVSGAQTYIEEETTSATPAGAPRKAPKATLSHLDVIPVTAQAKALKVSYSDDIVTGVEDVCVDIYAEPEYYNLQGIRVYSPRSGEVYVVRRGTLVTKELIK